MPKGVYQSTHSIYNGRQIAPKSIGKQKYSFPQSNPNQSIKIN